MQGTLDQFFFCRYSAAIDAALPRDPRSPPFAAQPDLLESFTRALDAGFAASWRIADGEADVSCCLNGADASRSDLFLFSCGAPAAFHTSMNKEEGEPNHAPRAN